MERLFQYAVILHPTAEEKKKGVRSKLVISPTALFLARNEDEVAMIAARSIPAEFVDAADRLEVAIRPF